MIAPNIEALIGNTPLVQINSLSHTHARVLAKCEFMNPNSSIKDRIAMQMVNEALQSKQIDLATTIIEPTSGNTGVGLASICASKGIKLILTMPDSMSIERRKLLTYLGAELILTPADEGMVGAIAKAHALEKHLDNAKVLQQFNNPNNPKAHLLGTSQEILSQTQGEIDIFVAAVGTGGTITGTGAGLKTANASISIVAVEPASSAILSGKPAGSHAIQGIGAGFVPEILDQEIYDEIITVSDADAYAMARQVARQEGLLVGISSGANLCAAEILASRPENQGKTIVTILCDTAERYLSTALFDV